MKKIVAVTACPTGIAHTYMAAENLQKAAAELGVEIKVETQGSVGAENVLTSSDIQNAEGVIFAADKTIEKDRFQGLPYVEVGVQDGVHRPKELIEQILQGNAKTIQTGNGQETKNEDKQQNPIYRHLMNGVSFMIPFIVVGGLLIAISISLGGVPTEDGMAVPEDSVWSIIEAIGASAFTFMVPILAGFIAMSIADRPGLAPGMIGGLLAADGSIYGSEAEAGFIGGIIAGFLAGYVALLIKKIPVPKAVQPVMPIIFIPVLSSLIVGLLFVFVIGEPVAFVFDSLTQWLEGLEGTNAILLALILGAMISFDMGGPVNKVAFLFGAAMITEGNLAIMGAVATAIAIPPIGLGLATFINRKKYDQSERETGKASFTMGLFGITEGAIPFAARDPFRVIPTIMIGSMAGAAIAMAADVGGSVAHGGPIVGVLGAIEGVIMFFVAILIGSVITAILVNLIKKTVTENTGSAPAGSASNDQAKEQIAPAQPSTVSFEKLTDLINKDLIVPTLQSNTRDGIIDELIHKLHEEDVITDVGAFRQVILDREAEGSTGLGMQIAIPHGKSDHVKEPAVAFGIQRDGVDWNSLDGEHATLIFMIAVPKEREGDDHLKILQLLSRKLMDDEFREDLSKATSMDDIYEHLDEIR
ncbi:PTS fructose transporter subunit IIABC [Geomicrobium sp. JCM 19039]|uniref:PTS fructose transporter subunit IIABC n=1 Tax=Geomicrobium sp. JCM 19039 TaxID=1460636 RepID=UPI00045F12DD|nr:PTS fructose transporter subunit IIABC [Geomicrobium sp. JCM 19039]GAK14163.1 PTS system, mannose-specific IIB component [Geomicrobium sp. JCM 19039]